jgi:DNA-binding CsgD family transcriptional regulator
MKNLLLATLLMVASALPGLAGPFEDEIAQHLRAQGFAEIDVNRSFLGRSQIIARNTEYFREIIVNPVTGVILRDFTRREDGTALDRIPDPDPGQTWSGAGSSMSSNQATTMIAMPMTPITGHTGVMERLSRPAALGFLLAAQMICAVFFLFEILAARLVIPMPPINWHVHELIEIGAALGLIVGTVITAVLMRASHLRSAHVESQLRAASGAFMDLLEDRFAAWNLTPAERDVALFCIKGLATAEIARLRATSEGTVKAQTNAIYRKAGVSGRPQLLSLFIDDLIDGPLT